MSPILVFLTAVLVCGCADGCASTVTNTDIYSAFCTALSICDQYSQQVLEAAWATFCPTVNECDASPTNMPDQEVLVQFLAFLAGTTTTAAATATTTTAGTNQ